MFLPSAGRTTHRSFLLGYTARYNITKISCKIPQPTTRLDKIATQQSYPLNPTRTAASITAQAPNTKPTMDQDIEETVERIHSTQAKIVVYTTGGGSQAPGWLLSVPGASRTVLDIQIPYATSALTQILGYKPRSSVCAEVSVDLAKAAYQKAANLGTIGTPLIGIGATCALSTDRDRRGDNKAFVTAHNGTSTKTYSLRLSKGHTTRRRSEEDAITSRLLIKAVADAMGVGNNFTHLGLSTATSNDGSTDSLEVTQEAVVNDEDDGIKALIKQLLSGSIRTLEISGTGGIVVDAPRRGRVYLPGSFNPLHDGHKELLAAACRLKPGMEGCYELSVGNADKGRLPVEEIERRVRQFTAAQLPVVLTQAPLFTMKAELFPDSIFVVGYDTALRLVQEKYYGNDTAMLLQFAKLRHQGCSFLVGGRKDESGRFLEMKDLDVPETLQRGGLFEGVPESEFRLDISSTELRQQRGASSPI